MRFAKRQNSLPSWRPSPPASNLLPRNNPNWTTERSGHFEGYAVSGWRYIDLPIWHVTVCLSSDDRPGRTYVISAGEFYPDSVAPEEKRAALQLIAFWEAEGLDRQSSSA